MSMSTHIEALMPDTDPEYQRHKKVFLTCMEANVSLPKETQTYFGTSYGYPGVLTEKLQIELTEGEHFTEINEDSEKGFEVDLTKLPPGITKLRFYNSW